MICTLLVSPELFIRYCAAADDLNSAHSYSGVVDRMSKESESATASRPSDRPVIILEVYSGEQPREDWSDHFESIAAINGWNEEKKLVWLKVHLTGRALLAFKKFSVTTKASYKNVVVAMQERFEPQSKRDLYLAEFQVHCKKRTETWADYGEDLRILVDKAYPTLDDDARQQLALQRYLSQLQDEQVAFGVKQRKPKTIEAAVAATLELESYLVSHSTSGTVAPVQVPADRAGQKSLMDMMSQLMTRMDKLEATNFKQIDRVGDRVDRPAKSGTGDASYNQRVVVCFRRGQEGHFARGCAQPSKKKFPNQGNY